MTPTETNRNHSRQSPMMRYDTFYNRLAKANGGAPPAEPQEVMPGIWWWSKRCFGDFTVGETRLNLFTLFYSLQNGETLDEYLKEYANDYDYDRQQAQLATKSIATFLIGGPR